MKTTRLTKRLMTGMEQDAPSSRRALVPDSCELFEAHPGRSARPSQGLHRP